MARRGIKKGVCEPLNRYLRSYFVHWRDVNKFYKIALNAKIKSLVIKVYKTKLSDALAVLKAKGAKKKRKKRKMMTEAIESNNDTL